MSEQLSDVPQEPHPSRTRTEPYVFDAAVEMARWADWRRTNAPADDVDARTAELHKAMALISLPALP